jgi:NAD(P)-dependent dehydrogenase (short-subunit alcohol dehydrogenase family)
MGRLDNKVAIVTGAGCVGAGWGNGRAIATRFVEEGAYVLAVDLSLDQLEDTMKYAMLPTWIRLRL